MDIKKYLTLGYLMNKEAGSAAVKGFGILFNKGRNTVPRIPTNFKRYIPNTTRVNGVASDGVGAIGAKPLKINNDVYGHTPEAPGIFDKINKETIKKYLPYAGAAAGGYIASDIVN